MTEPHQALTAYNASCNLLLPTKGFTAFNGPYSRPRLLQPPEALDAYNGSNSVSKAITSYSLKTILQQRWPANDCINHPCIFVPRYSPPFWIIPELLPRDTGLPKQMTTPNSMVCFSWGTTTCHWYFNAMISSESPAVSASLQKTRRAI